MMPTIPPIPTPTDFILAPLMAMKKEVPKPSDVVPNDPSIPNPEVIETKAETVVDEVTRPPRRVVDEIPRPAEILGEAKSLETMPKPIELLEVLPSPGDFFNHFPGPFRDIPPPHEFVKNLDRMMDDSHNNSQALYGIVHARLPVAAKDWSDMAMDAHELRRDVHELNKIGMEFLKQLGKAVTNIAKEGIPFIPGI